VKTDDEGHYIKTEYSLSIPKTKYRIRPPALTTAGKAVLGLLAIFLIFSIYVTRTNSNETTEKEKQLRNDLEKMQGQNSFLQGELDKVVNPIEDVDLNLIVIVPFDYPALAAYWQRLLKGITAFLASSEASRRLNRDVEVRPYVEDDISVDIPRGSSLLPREKTESLAYSILEGIKVDVIFTKTPIVPLNGGVAMNEIKRDLGRQFGMDVLWSESKTEMIYDVNEHQLSLLYNEENLKYRTWYQTGKIVSIRDLLGAQMIINLSGITRTVSDHPNSELDQHFRKILSRLSIDEFMIDVPGRRRFNFTGDQLKRYVDADGFPVYVYTFPSTTEEFNARY
jgi:hypothetical protein